MAGAAPPTGYNAILSSRSQHIVIMLSGSESYLLHEELFIRTAFTTLTWTRRFHRSMLTYIQHSGQTGFQRAKCSQIIRGGDVRDRLGFGPSVGIVSSSDSLRLVSLPLVTEERSAESCVSSRAFLIISMSMYFITKGDPFSKISKRNSGNPEWSTLDGFSPSFFAFSFETVAVKMNSLLFLSNP
mmetsp:Transcript_14147/g.34483  ORF Transcript_14147/g.34483 Transcript_14147/m.34483 type:complete len:185 (+) Transcript_14147:175-729(+)